MKAVGATKPCFFGCALTALKRSLSVVSRVDSGGEVDRAAGAVSATVVEVEGRDSVDSASTWPLLFDSARLLNAAASVARPADVPELADLGLGVLDPEGIGCSTIGGLASVAGGGSSCAANCAATASLNCLWL